MGSPSASVQTLRPCGSLGNSPLHGRERERERERVLTELARQCNGGAEGGREALIAAWAVFSRCDRQTHCRVRNCDLSKSWTRHFPLSRERATVHFKSTTFEAADCKSFRTRITCIIKATGFPKSAPRRRGIAARICVLCGNSAVLHCLCLLHTSPPWEVARPKSDHYPKESFRWPQFINFSAPPPSSVLMPRGRDGTGE